MRTEEFLAFINKRQQTLMNKLDGLPKPWTDDPILQGYRFCNVHREDDTVTQWIALNWRWPLEDSHNLWFWMLVARLVNHPPTLAAMTAMAQRDRWDRNTFVKVIEAAQKSGVKAWGGAYIVSTNGVQAPKAQYIADSVLSPAWHHRKLTEPRKGDSLFQFCSRLLVLNGVQGFIAGQVIADTKYANSSPLRNAGDWDTFAVSGPGSRRGLNRVVQRKVDAPWKEREWKVVLLDLRLAVNSCRDRDLFDSPIHAQDIQNCLCEWDKYERVRLGQGKPRSTYPGAA